ncbi:heavy-metal-associated domain-containing protein [Labilibaculum euxinus]|uniref:ATPase n=1 Tax=Labilibaculum euxinus TaxID=2686357 RepID=A0A7M4D9S4_9BACT|nr:cation transporter [Labilibaculum euxinus]MUP39403.1 ATPase [Labilibaculum euxinus]MVB08608.1 ATPase [Labilibaculum euxinus]
MKLKLVGLIGLFLVSGLSLSAQEKNDKFKVFGNCGMCENRIEKAALAVDGVSLADWNKETKMIDVAFDTTKTDIHKVHMAIADAGHDTEMHTAKDEIYNKLPGCCKYDRTNAEMKSDEGHHQH